jgi:hypothetical protein
VQSNIAHPMRLTVGVEEARNRIEQIPHATCRSAAERHWNVADEARVPEESVNWLFCWGKTGMGSRAAAEEAKRVFDAILPVPFHGMTISSNTNTRGHTGISPRTAVLRTVRFQ